LLGGRLRLKRCPDCGSALRKTKKSYIYECPNPECPVIEVRFHSHRRVSTVRDPTMQKEWEYKVWRELCSREKLKALLRIIKEHGRGMFSR